MAAPTTTTIPTGTIISATAAATAAGSIMESDNQTECRLLGSFAIFVQLALGGLALMSLVYKRWRERPQRPVKIWFFDVSKQVFGSFLVHGANVFMSLLTSGKFSIQTTPEVVIHQERMVRRGLEIVGMGLGMLAKRAEEADEPYVPNPCSFYLLNLAIDTTLGIPILIIIVRVTTKLVAYTPLGKPIESIQSGNYGEPPNAWWWLKQSIIYFCGLMGMKLVVLIIFMVFPWISRVGDWALGWTEGNEKLQIVFVMMLFPLIMNAMQYYIIDSYIKKQIESGASEDGCSSDAGSDTERSSVGSGTAVAGGHGGVSYGVISASDSDSEASDDDDDDGDDDKRRVKKRGQRMPLTRRDSSKDREYDPTIDGDEGTVVGSSSSMASEVRRGLLGKELR
ncbi:vacuolar membrane domain containing protein [Rhypophila decipiens]